MFPYSGVYASVRGFCTVLHLICTYGTGDYIMKLSLSQTAIEQAKPKQKAYEIRDTRLSGFLIRVQPSGRKTYYCEYRRGARVKIGLFQTLSTKQARSQAQKIIADYSCGGDPAHDKKNKRDSLSYGKYLETYYYPWIDVNLRTAHEYRRVLNKDCHVFKRTPLSQIDIKAVEKWRLALLTNGKTPTTTNRVYASLRASLSKAEEWGLIDVHPLLKMKPLKVPQSSVVRYLSTDEEVRLRAAIECREEARRLKRASANKWRQKRGYLLFTKQDKNCFTDHLKPMIILSMNTGMRRGEVFKLKWSNVNFETKHVTVEGVTAKSGKIRHIPLNKEAIQILQSWKGQTTSNSSFVFSNPQDKPFVSVKKGWQALIKAAAIEDFRWHDLRHHFASSLVMRGVNLNTVRELLGHSSYAMTLRYAHLSAGHKAEAVELLC